MPEREHEREHERAPERDSAEELRITVVIPALNEAANLPHILPVVRGLAAEVILVDGHSTDDTIAVARRLLPEIRIIQQQGVGKGDALRTGFEIATGDVIVMLDADGSADPLEIPRFAATLLAGADFAKGSRFLAQGGSADLTHFRRAGNHALSGLVNGLFGMRFTDLCYGYNAFWRDCLECFVVDCPGFEVETLLAVRACKARLRIVEVPSYEHARIHGVSRLRIMRDGWRVLCTILRERFNGRSVITERRHGARRAVAPRKVLPLLPEEPQHIAIARKRA